MPNWTSSELAAHEARHQMIVRCASVAVAREIDLHLEIIRFCDAQWPRWKVIRARSDIRSTIAVGAQDFTIFAPGRVLCIECKGPGGKLSAEQLAWALEMQKLGHTVHLVESFEQFLKLIYENATTNNAGTSNP